MYKDNTLREREILKLHYGWDGAKCKEYEEIGDMFNILGQVVRNSQVRAITKLRKSGWWIRKTKEIGYIKRANSSKVLTRE